MKPSHHHRIGRTFADTAPANATAGQRTPGAGRRRRAIGASRFTTSAVDGGKEDTA